MKTPNILPERVQKMTLERARKIIDRCTRRFNRTHYPELIKEKFTEGEIVKTLLGSNSLGHFMKTLGIREVKENMGMLVRTRKITLLEFTDYLRAAKCIADEAKKKLGR